MQDALMSPARINKMHCSSSGFKKLFIKNSLNFLEFCEIVSVGEASFLKKKNTLCDSENRRFLKYLGLGHLSSRSLEVRQKG